jgi:hypothetical protein
VLALEAALWKLALLDCAVLRFTIAAAWGTELFPAFLHHISHAIADTFLLSCILSRMLIHHGVNQACEVAKPVQQDRLDFTGMW